MLLLVKITVAHLLKKMGSIRCGVIFVFRKEILKRENEKLSKPRVARFFKVNTKD